MDEEKRKGLAWYDDAQLPSGAVRIYQPSRFDVLLGRGRGHVANPGNRRLQVAVNMHKDRYNSPSTTRAEKTKITTDIVHFIKGCGSEQGRFLKYHGIMGSWFEVEDEVARLKVSQALRYTRRALSSSCISSEDQDSVSVASQLSHNDADFVVPPVTSSSSDHATSKGKTGCESRKTGRPNTHFLGCDTGSSLDPIGPDFEW
jgi:hypothetical protein